MALSKNELYEQLLKEKDRVIVVLSDMVDVLRWQLHAQGRMEQGGLPAIPARSGEDGPDYKMWESEEEADLRHLVENERISIEDAQVALEAIGSLNMEDILIS